MENHKMHRTTPTLSRQRYLIRICCLVMSLLFGSALVVPTQADGPLFLVKDINPAPNTSSIPNTNGSIPNTFETISGTLFFQADDGVHGNELWKSNGTNAGTVLVKDIVPGSDHSYNENLTNVNGTLFFSSATATTARALWKSDGTAAGTVLVKDIAPGATSLVLSHFTNVNGMLFFFARKNISDYTLWRSDGTSAGTIQLAEFTYVAGGLTDFNGTLVFSLFDPGPGSWLAAEAHSAEPAAEITSIGLWKSNGTVAGTVPIKEGITITSLTYLDDTIIFSETSAAGGTDLWASDGTAAGTAKIKDIVPPPGTLSGSFLARSQGSAFFSFQNAAQQGELWKTDGTSAGTSLVKAINVAFTVADLNGTLFFTIEDQDPNLPGVTSELWKTDGTAAGTVLVTRFEQGQQLLNLLDINGTLVFFISYYDQVEQRPKSQLWKSNGTAAGTTLIQPLDLGIDNALPEVAHIGPYLLFSGDDHSGIGTELWAMRTAIDTAVQSPSVAGAPPSGTAAVPIQYGNHGITSASALTLTATLDPVLTYLGDTSGITPTVSGQTLTWRIADASVVNGRNFTLSVRTPNAAYGTRYPIALALAVAGQESYPTDNNATVQVMIARQVYLPFARR
jgi:ELWxxDGT repeat protein